MTIMSYDMLIFLARNYLILDTDLPLLIDAVEACVCMSIVAQCRAAGWLVSVVLVRQLHSHIHTKCQTAASAGAEESDLSYYPSLATDMVSLSTVNRDYICCGIGEFVDLYSENIY